MSLPSSATSLSTEDLCLVVHAPFGDDYALSRYPDGETLSVLRTPLVESLRGVASTGVAVVALVDLPGEATHLVNIPPGQPQAAHAEPHWKMDMSAAPTLSGLLRAAARAYPDRRLMLAVEGHGSGYQPAIDKAGLLALHEAGLVGDWHS
ncbi:MAG: hypothetical protein J0M20_06050, partial [Burkholderiales bacterium]|nr:hypothetical protein [Burkholderiales bacterium]